MMHPLHEDFMFRCLQLAALGAGYVAPNPMVGAVLVYNNKIIGEGYHKIYGKQHAEVNCINSVKQSDVHLIKDAVLYVSLEPCDHFGKTPPCTDLIIRNKIPKVVIGCQDIYSKVTGQGIEKLRNNNVEVVTGVLEKECATLNKRFFTYHLLKRSYIILKWAQTADNKIAYISDKRSLISNKFTNKLVHKWRSEEAGIVIGTNTALKDNPFLTNRLWNGKSPVRLVIDLDLKLAPTLNTFNNDAPTVIFNLHKHDSAIPGFLSNQVYYYQLEKTKIVQQILAACYTLNIQSIIVEGGQKLLQSFIDENFWDEARIITNQKLFIWEGLSAPKLLNAELKYQELYGDDVISILNNNSYN